MNAGKPLKTGIILLIMLWGIWSIRGGAWPVSAHASSSSRVGETEINKRIVDVTENGQAHADLLTHELRMRCQSPQSMTISWTTTREENVAGYKVHRHSLDGQQEHGWVNTIPISAQGPSNYRVLDSQVTAGRTYFYRLYVFDETYRLSRAQQIVLAKAAQPSCVHLPLILSIGAESTP